MIYAVPSKVGSLINQGWNWDSGTAKTVSPNLELLNLMAVTQSVGTSLTS